ncbi:MAG: hypothetical protein RLY97_2298 [Pseudomonadota bacterium]|jgi:hypothetical protein
MPESNHRQNDRDSLFLQANLRLPDQPDEYRVKIRNLSANGCMAESGITALVGTKIEIDIRNLGWIVGTVVWVIDSRMGIAFEDPIDPRVARQTIRITGDVDEMCVRRPMIVPASPVETPTPRFRTI